MHIKATNLNLQIGKHTILHNMNFEIEEPKIYGLLGRNGAGKTSLLSLIGAFREPTSGELLINNKVPFENGDITKDIIFMYDKDYSGETDPPSQCIKHIAHYRPYFDLEYARELLKKFQLEGKKSIAKLSKGKQSAFNVVLGLASRSPITIFDEVYLGMDAPARDIFYKELIKEQERNPRIIIMSTHLVSEMDYLFDEVIIIKEGKILLQEAYDAVVSRGVTIIGSKDSIDAFSKEKKILNQEQLGETKSVTLYGELSEDEELSAIKMGLSIEPVSLQDLFIHLTKEEN